MKKIIEITSQDTFIVRHPVLREGKPKESCVFEGDDLTTTKHFGFVENKKIVGVISVFKNKNSIFKANNQFQIRGMAVLIDSQKNGIGRQLIEHSENYIKTKKGNLIWFNAREKAVGFYEKLGYCKTGNPFLIADIGLHYIMYKEATTENE